MSSDNGSGTVMLPDYKYTISDEVKYFVYVGVLPVSTFDTTQLIEREDYGITFEVSSSGYLRI